MIHVNHVFHVMHAIHVQSVIMSLFYFICLFSFTLTYPQLSILNNGNSVGYQECYGSSACTLKVSGVWDNYYLRYTYSQETGYNYQAWSSGLGGGTCANLNCNTLGYFCCEQVVGLDTFMYSVFVNNTQTCANFCGVNANK